MAPSSRAVSTRVSSTRSAAKAAASREGHTLFYEPPTFEKAISQAPDLPTEYQYQPLTDITNINRLMEEVYSAITTWAGNVNNVYQRNHDTIRDCYQRVCTVVGTIEPENSTRLFTAMEEVAQLFLGDLYGQIIQFADDADQQQRALTRLVPTRRPGTKCRYLTSVTTPTVPFKTVDPTEPADFPDPTDKFAESTNTEP
ncbi:hypothetical protein E4U57_004801 [Claviceps arundinis]|uniref:Uncharacterized protein n=1 Tax=Claviceps arundinis TaxID=1623583 RepID=A0ABQ7P4H2_9HYPO|nr:hypothetical protein E4U57_004801 [Claviceps arundinis]